MVCRLELKVKSCIHEMDKKKIGGRSVKMMHSWIDD